MKKIGALLLSVILAITLVACNEKEEVFAPEEIQEGTDRCDLCNMLVPNDMNATQLILNDGRALKFDDIGCLYEWVEEHGLDDVNVRYVRDYYTFDWIQIEKATFVYDKDFRTPMAYGVYAFKSKDEAESFIEEEGKGKLLTYEDLNNHSWERNMELMEQMKQEHGHDHSEHHHEHDDGNHEHDDEHNGHADDKRETEHR